MQTYLVGGAIRDRMLGIGDSDRDYVVTGATPEQMQALGYKPVGRHFPVFLHPESKAEYALARTERKQGRGHQGFVFHTGADVTIEDDLIRRDLTINAMAEDAAGKLIDPYHGQQDLAARLLRHISPAFAEDPLRVLRVARFAAKLAPFGFTVADETMQLMRQISASGELQTLSAERVWQELHKALLTSAPQRFVEVLRSCGALAQLLPEVDALFGVPQVEKYHPEVDTGVHVLMTLQLAAEHNCAAEIRFALLLHDLGKALTPDEQLPKHHGHEISGVPLILAVCDRLKVPKKYRELAQLVGRWHLLVHRALELRAQTLLQLLERCDALRRPQRFALLLQACEMDKRGRLGLQSRPYPQRDYLLAAATALNSVTYESIDNKPGSGIFNQEAFRTLRLEMLKGFIKEQRKKEEYHD
ncbi:MAG: multifunctional CCA addition/repair protein [Wenzhouxiangellaceae bacterium]